MATYADTFTGSGSLGTSEYGGIPWESLSGSWSRSSGRAATSTSDSLNPLAVINTGVTDADITLNVSSGGGDCLYFRVKDANDWWRFRVHSYSSTSSSTQYLWRKNITSTEYEIADVIQYYWYNFTGHYRASWNGQYHYHTKHAGPFRDATSYSFQSSYIHTHSIQDLGSTEHLMSLYDTTRTLDHVEDHVTRLYWSSSSNPSGADYWTGNTRQVSNGTTSTWHWSSTSSPGSGYYYTGTSDTNYSTTYYYQARLEKSVNGSVSNVATHSDNSSLGELRVVIKGNTITPYVDGSQKSNIVDSTHQGAVKHGIGRGVSSRTSSAIDNFSLTTFEAPTPTGLYSDPSGTAGVMTPPITLGWDPYPLQSKYEIGYQFLNYDTDYVAKTFDGSSNSHQLPADTFVDGELFRWYVRVFDGSIWSDAAYSTFTAPGDPSWTTLPAVDSSTSAGLLDASTLSPDEYDIRVRVADAEGYSRWSDISEVSLSSATNVYLSVAGVWTPSITRVLRAGEWKQVQSASVIGSV